MNLYGRDLRIEKEMPKWFEKFVCVYLARLLKVKELNTAKAESIINDFGMKIALNEYDKQPFFKKSYETKKLMMEIEQIKFALTKLLEDQIDNKKIEEKELKWKYAAIIFDRLFLLLSIIYFILSFSIIVLSISNFYKLT